MCASASLGEPRIFWVDSVQCHVPGLRACVRYTTLFELLALTIHLFKKTLAGQFRFAAALTKSNACVSSE
jgi:hypothetical protein